MSFADGSTKRWRRRCASPAHRRGSPTRGRARRRAEETVCVLRDADRRIAAVWLRLRLDRSRCIGNQDFCGLTSRPSPTRRTHPPMLGPLRGASPRSATASGCSDHRSRRLRLVRLRPRRLPRSAPGGDLAGDRVPLRGLRPAWQTGARPLLRGREDLPVIGLRPALSPDCRIELLADSAVTGDDVIELWSRKACGMKSPSRGGASGCPRSCWSAFTRATGSSGSYGRLPEFHPRCSSTAGSSACSSDARIALEPPVDSA